MMTATPTTEARPHGGLARVDQACEFLAVSRSCLYALMDNKTLQYVKIGRGRRIRWDSLLALAAAGTAAAR
jgi:excisionase family DNA binding protein